MFKLNTVLYPTDFSKPAEYAFQLACSMARDHGAKVVILHVLQPMYVDGELMVALPLPPVDCKALMWESFRKLQDTDPRARCASSRWLRKAMPPTPSWRRPRIPAPISSSWELMAAPG